MFAVGEAASLVKTEAHVRRQYLGTIVLLNSSSSSSRFKLFMDDPDENHILPGLENHFSDLFVLLFYMLLYSFLALTGLLAIVLLSYILFKFIQNYKRHYLPRAAVKRLPTHKFKPGDEFESCAVCLEDYEDGDKLRLLPCDHGYHAKCIDMWLVKTDSVCPQCRKRVFSSNENLSRIVFGSARRSYGSLSTSNSRSQRHSRLLYHDGGDLDSSSRNSVGDSSLTTPLLGQGRQEFRFFRPLMSVDRTGQTDLQSSGRGHNSEVFSSNEAYHNLGFYGQEDATNSNVVSINRLQETASPNTIVSMQKKQISHNKSQMENLSNYQARLIEGSEDDMTNFDCEASFNIQEQSKLSEATLVHLPPDGYVSTSMRSKELSGMEPSTCNHSNNTGLHVAHVINKNDDTLKVKMKSPRYPLVRSQSDTTENNTVIHSNKNIERTTQQNQVNQYTHPIYCKKQSESTSTESSTFYQGAAYVEDPDQNDVKNV